jgi:hypothetical protein
MREAKCKVCGDYHEWELDEGIGGAFGQGWIYCPDYGYVPVGKKHTRET